ncbi:MAG: hypothetical protein WCV99_06965 [Sterolibacterium sp.]|jgi:hypothetical protein
MRNLITLILSMFLSMNAAHAAVVGICDALEQGAAHGVAAEHRAHFGHHSHHAQGADAASDKVSDASAKTAGADQKSPTTTPSDHSHAHPSFSTLLPGSVVVSAVSKRDVMTTSLSDVFVSAHPSRLERPPRASLA